MDGIFKRIGGWFAGVLTAVVLGVIFQTQNVLARLDDIGADVGFAERLSMTLYDLQHLGSLYIIFVSIALAIAFLVGGLVYRFAKFGRPIVYCVAGAVAILVMLFAMKANFFDIHIIAGARDAFGISLQMLAGAIGGFVFARISRPNKKASAHNAEASIV
ncbi:MAG: hypothetical protein ABJO36_13700 [Litorimonas sp.]